MRRCVIVFVLLALAIPSFAGGAKEAGEVTLTFPSFWVGHDSKAGPVAQLVRKFNTDNAGRIKVVVEENPSVDGYRTKINASLAAGAVPDIFIFNPDPTTFQYYESDILLDLTEDLKGPWAKDFLDGYILASTKNGRTKTVPFEIGIAPIWVNEELLKRSGASEMPKTYDEFFAVADKLKTAGVTPTSQMTGGVNAWTSMLWYSNILASIGGPEVWNRPLTHPQYVQAFEILLKMYQDGNTTKDAVGGDAGVAGGHFLAGRTAFFINGPWFIGRLKRDAPPVYANTRFHFAPAVKGGHSGGLIGFQLSNLAAANPKTNARRDAAVKFLQWMTTPDNVKMISEVSGAMFAIRYQLSDAADPLLKRAVAMSNEAKFIVPHFQSQYPVEVTQELGQAIGAMVLGKATPREAVQMLIRVNK